MCVLVFALKSHPEYKFIFAGNRDEFYSRPTKPASIWGDDVKILSGIDLKSSGTWLGVTIERSDSIPAGDFAVITNFRDFYHFKENPELWSRGKLVADFLQSNFPFAKTETRFRDFIDFLFSNSKNFNPFNLIFGNFDELYYFTNVDNRFELISNGIHGLSNNFLDIPWPKVHWAKLRFSDIIQNSNNLIDDLFELFSDNSQFDDELLPDTGVGIERERLLSSIFIKSEIYGTRSTTIILVDYNNNIKFIERNYNHENYFDQVFELKI